MLCPGQWSEGHVMEMRPLVVAGVAAGCIAAAGFGAYLAGRHNAGEIAKPAPAVSESRSDSKAPVGGGVAETEAIVTDERAEPATGTVAQAPARKPAAAPASRPVASNTPAADPAPAPAASAAPADPSWQGLDKPWPPRPAEPATDSTIPDVGAALTPEPYEPPKPQYEELTLETNSVIGLQIETPVTTERAQIEDRVNAKVTRDVLVGGKVGRAHV